MYYEQSLIDEVRARSDIVDVVSSVVHMEKKGSGYMGLCPFHNEKTPSFHVDPSRQIFHCFGCGEGGNVFTFLQKYDNMSFPEAVRELASRAGVTLPEDTGTDRAALAKAKDKRERLLAINKAAAVWYYRTLRDKRGEIGLKYFRGRGLSDKIMNTFGLGYAPVEKGALLDMLHGEGFADMEIIEAGIAVYDEKRGIRDKFWNRVMFPIQDMNGRVIGFGGRVMGDGEPKYLNSPETPVFDKSRNLYGLNFARKVRKGRMILCEGYMDVIAMHEAGFTEAVASLGTAFTIGQANILKRYTEEVILSYDMDAAGTKAALRACSMLREAGIRARILNLAPHKDPDEFIRAEGTEAFEERLREAENPFFFEVRQTEKSFDIRDPGERTKFHRELAAKLVTSFEDPIERENYLKDMAAHYGIAADDLKELTVRFAAQGTPVRERRPEFAVDPKTAKRTRDNKREDRNLKGQRMLLTWMSGEPALFPAISSHLKAEDFAEGIYERVAEKVFEGLRDGTLNVAALIGTFEDEEVNRVSGILTEPLPETGTASEKERALHDLVADVMKSGAEKRLKSMDPADASYLKETIDSKKRLEEFKKIKIL